MRGEQVEVVRQSRRGQPAGQADGRIIGVEKQKVAAGKAATVDVEVLNMWCAEGVRAVKLTEVQRLRFANPVIESEFRRALETLALSPRQRRRRRCSLHFAGEGKRQGAGRAT